MREQFFAQARDSALIGRQDLIRGDGTPGSTANGSLVSLGGLQPGTYSFPIDVAGNTNLRVLLNPSLLQAPPPTSPAVATSATGGTLPAGTYYYKITAILAGGETGPSTEASVTTTGATSSNTLSWVAPNWSNVGLTGYRIYRGTAAGAENVYYAVGLVTTYVDTNAASTAGSPPASAAAATVSLQPTLTDRQTLDTTVAAVVPALTVGTLTAAALTLSGHAVAMLTITVPPRGFALFSVAEFMSK